MTPIDWQAVDAAVGRVTAEVETSERQYLDAALIDTPDLRLLLSALAEAREKERRVARSLSGNPDEDPEVIIGRICGSLDRIDTGLTQVEESARSLVTTTRDGLLDMRQTLDAARGGAP